MLAALLAVRGSPPLRVDTAAAVVADMQAVVAAEADIPAVVAAVVILGVAAVEDVQVAVEDSHPEVEVEFMRRLVVERVSLEVADSSRVSIALRRSVVQVWEGSPESVVLGQP